MTTIPSSEPSLNSSYLRTNRRQLLQAGIALGASYLVDMPQSTHAAESGTTLNDIVALRSAENPYGPPPSALRAVQEAVKDGNRYPRSKVTEFRELVARDAGVKPENVIVGAGSIELMINAGLHYGKLGRSVVAADPTWDTTALYAEANGAKWVRVPLTKDFRYDFDGMLSAINDSTGLVYICHPNNPTGLAEEHATLKKFVQAAAERAPVMIDEAFIDCLDRSDEVSMKSLVATSDNIIVSRTFSKLWGMAGFRVGYMLGPAALLAQFKETVPHLEMQSRISVAAAIAAFQDRDFIKMSREKMLQSRQLIFAALDRRGLKYISSDCNFVTFEVPEDAEATRLKLLERGVALKNVTFGGRQRLRVSCGTPRELGEFERSLAAIA